MIGRAACMLDMEMLTFSVLILRIHTAVLILYGRLRSAEK